MVRKHVFLVARYGLVLFNLSLSLFHGLLMILKNSFGLLIPQNCSISSSALFSFFPLNFQQSLALPSTIRFFFFMVGYKFLGFFFLQL